MKQNKKHPPIVRLAIILALAMMSVLVLSSVLMLSKNPDYATIDPLIIRFFGSGIAALVISLPIIIRKVRSGTLERVYDTRVEDAIAAGRVVQCRLQRYWSNYSYHHEKKYRFDSYNWGAKYTYEVNGKTYKITWYFEDFPPLEMEAYYEEGRPNRPFVSNRWLNRGQYYLWVSVPFVIFAIIMTIWASLQ